MKLNELLQSQLHESVTFSVAKLVTDDPQYPRGLLTSQEFETEKVEDCWACDGTGKESHDGWTDQEGVKHPPASWACDLCRGKGKLTKWETPYNELNVSNDNATAILQALGLWQNDELVGHVDHDDLPALRRKLIRIKNGGIEALTKDPEDTQGPTRRYKGDDGMDHIGRGPRVISGGRTHEQVMRYVDSLLSLIDFAQKNDAALAWA